MALGNPGSSTEFKAAGVSQIITVISAPLFRTGPPQQPLRARMLARAEQILGTRSPREFARTMALPRIALADVATRRFHGHRRSAAALLCSSAAAFPRP